MTKHALVSHLKEYVELGAFNVSQNGRLIYLNSSNSIGSGKYELMLKQKNKPLAISLISTQEIHAEMYKKEQALQISGLISYGVSRTGMKGSFCPFFNGKFEGHGKSHFTDYLQRNMGVKITDLSVFRFPNERLNSKIQLNNQLKIIVEGEVTSPEITSSLFFTSVGQKVSYGFGKLDLSPLSS
jgi:hypothetical protein